MTDFEIKQGVANAAAKLSKQRLDEKAKLFLHVDVPFISIKYRTELAPVSRKQIRMFSDLIDAWYPLYRKSDDQTKAEFIQDIFKCVCSAEDLAKLKTFKEITHKRVITANNENVKVISRLRWRSRGNRTRNYIHSRI